MYVRIGQINQGQLAACDGCGTVVMLRRAKGWRTFTTASSHTHHHCEACAEYNGLVAAGLVFGEPGDTAVTYDT